MGDPVKIAAIVGTYRKGGVIDQLVDALLVSAQEQGAQTEKLYLLDTHIESCTNCRLCTQEPGAARGICPIADQMTRVLDLVEGCDALVLATPMNFGGVTAIMKRFLERLVCYAYWPWGTRAPRLRSKEKPRRAVLIASSAAPAVLARLMTPITKTMRQAAELMGARTVGAVFVGLATREDRQAPGTRALEKARVMGKRLAAGR